MLLHSLPKSFPDFCLTRKKNWIECKATGADSLKKKAAAWEEALILFNASAECPRSLKQLKTFYENKKRNARRDLAEQNRLKYRKIAEELDWISEEAEAAEKKIVEMVEIAKEEEKATKSEIFKTGGGKSEAPGISGTSQQILAILGDKMVPLTNVFDSAALYHGGNFLFCFLFTVCPEIDLCIIIIIKVLLVFPLFYRTHR